MLEEGQEADVAAGGDALEQRDVPVPGVQLHHVVKGVGRGFPRQQQVDELLWVRERGGSCQGGAGAEETGGAGRRAGGGDPEIAGESPKSRALGLRRSHERWGKLPALLIEVTPGARSLYAESIRQAPVCTGPCPEALGAGVLQAGKSGS